MKLSKESRLQFEYLYGEVFNPDGSTKNCTRYPCINLIEFCDTIAHVDLPEDEKTCYDDDRKQKAALEERCYYGNKNSGFMEIERIKKLYAETASV